MLYRAVPQVMAALEALQTGRQQQQQQKVDVLWAVLHLLAGHQVKAAVALAVSVGDVRLASLLACVNTAARGRHAQQLMQQIQVGRGRGGGGGELMGARGGVGQCAAGEPAGMYWGGAGDSGRATDSNRQETWDAAPCVEVCWLLQRG
jgi:hypothetical protein